ncbi:MAG: RsmB/NOP family class I SAM-dependent RNA methyltransferase [Candidatus Heimdallarchaeota archaeon]
MKALELAARVLTQASVSRNSSRKCLYQLWEQNDISDRGLFNAIYHYSMETVRRQNYLDEFVNRMFNDTEPDLFVTNLFRVATYMIRILEEPLESVATQIEKILNGKREEEEVRYFVTRLFRLGAIDLKDIYAEKTKIQQLALKYVHPVWFVKHFTSLLGEKECLQLMEANNVLKNIWVRVNTLKTTTEKAIRELEAANIILEEDPEFPDLLRIVSWKDTPVILTDPYQEGHVFTQDKASCGAVYALDPAPGETILDMCSAPGMKTSLIAQLMENRGRIIAVDFSKKRLLELKHIVRRAGVSIVEPLIVDVRDLKPTQVDRLLLDPPCSSTGIFHMYPDNKWRIDPEVVLQRARFQFLLFEKALEFLESGGIGIYSVCSTMPEEGEELIDSFLDRIQLYPIHLNRKGLSKGIHENVLRSGPKTVRFWPHRDDCAGFFVAKFGLLTP